MHGQNHIKLVPVSYESPFFRHFWKHHARLASCASKPPEYYFYWQLKYTVPVICASRLVMTRLGSNNSGCFRLLAYTVKRHNYTKNTQW